MLQASEIPRTHGPKQTERDAPPKTTKMKILKKEEEIGLWKFEFKYEKPAPKFVAPLSW
jgi:hypothetical protein